MENLSQQIECGQADAFRAFLEEDPELRQELLSVFSVSEFVAQRGRLDFPWFFDFLRCGAYLETLNEHAIAAEMAFPADDLKRWVRTVRQRCMVRIFWRNISGRNTLVDTVRSVSLLADTLIDAVLQRLYAAACEREGEPVGESSGEPQRLVVLALGKLGAGELNLSSDVDLIFSYPEAGVTRNSGKSNQAFFLRLCRKLINVLNEVTAEGFVFRVDMRLRPYGESGALVLNFRAMELYYSQQGRDWERYAWIKARVCAGDTHQGAELLAILRPFVYRKYLDFGAIQSLRDMKTRVHREHSRQQMNENLKLGSGGIRDVEFIVQVFQMIFGGREPVLRETNLLRALAGLVRQGHLQQRTAHKLQAAYEFLRNSEHAIQGLRDEQTQRLPTRQLDQLRLSWVMHCAGTADYLSQLAVHRRSVSQQFDALIKAPRSTTDEEHWRALWLAQDATALSAAVLQQWQTNHPDSHPGDQAKLATALNAIRSECERSWVERQTRQRLNAIMPRLLQTTLSCHRPAIALCRVLEIFHNILRRSAYLALLIENPAALKDLVSLCDSSAFLARELANSPMLLDELLDTKQLYALRSQRAVAQELAQRVAGLDAEDLEGAMDLLRHFKQYQVFQIALWEVQGILPLMQISGRLTLVAEVILQQALQLAWQMTCRRFGGRAGSAEDPPVAIIGYGKLGSLELGPGSDLDLVFLHDLDVPSFGSDAGQLLHRFTRKMLNILGLRTRAGVLYEVDTRLRPSGRSGTMISSLPGFERYQIEDAWVWEQQALVRARAVAGSPRLAAAFEQVRRQSLRRAREPVELRRAIVAMRARIKESNGGPQDLKKASGGIVDIEFMVQYLVLAWAHRYPRLCEYTDNVRILQIAAAEGLISPQDESQLIAAYLELRAELHRSILDQPDSQQAGRLLQQHSAGVRDCWNRLFSDAVTAGNLAGTQDQSP